MNLLETLQCAALIIRQIPEWHSRAETSYSVYEKFIHIHLDDIMIADDFHDHPDTDTRVYTASLYNYIYVFQPFAKKYYSFGK